MPPTLDTERRENAFHAVSTVSFCKLLLIVSWLLTTGNTKYCSSFSSHFDSLVVVVSDLFGGDIISGFDYESDHQFTLQYYKIGIARNRIILATVLHRTNPLAYSYRYNLLPY
jgi:hypothetical protein